MPKQVDCFVCGKPKLTHNVIGLNKKFLGRSVVKFHCLLCLAEFLDISADELEERIGQFRDAGCDLFL